MKRMKIYKKEIQVTDLTEFEDFQKNINQIISDSLVIIRNNALGSIEAKVTFELYVNSD